MSRVDLLQLNTSASHKVLHADLSTPRGEGPCGFDYVQLNTSMSQKAFHSELTSPRDGGRCTLVHERHEANKTRRAVETNAKAIENRINFFKREEEKVWRDLEDVRRQAATVEEGRTRNLEKKIAERGIQQEREIAVQQNRARAAATKAANAEQIRKIQFQQMREKQLAGQEQRKSSADILRRKRMQDAQHRLQNSEKAVANQRAQLEARLRLNQEKADRLQRMREQQEVARDMAEQEVTEAESKLPQLEAEEIACLQRLQNSRIVTQSVLEELEGSLGSSSSVTTLLRQKQRGQERMDSAPTLYTSRISEEESTSTPLGFDHALPAVLAG